MWARATLGGPITERLTGGLRSWPTEFSARQVYSPWSSYCSPEMVSLPPTPLNNQNKYKRIFILRNLKTDLPATPRAEVCCQDSSGSGLPLPSHWSSTSPPYCPVREPPGRTETTLAASEIGKPIDYFISQYPKWVIWGKSSGGNSHWTPSIRVLGSLDPSGLVAMQLYAPPWCLETLRRERTGPTPASSPVLLRTQEPWAIWGQVSEYASQDSEVLHKLDRDHLD